ncbi:MAG: HD domain-containing protein [Firmicutes bacterium]|nr:HD domain-containing protein [Bacillota bacterium]
MYEYIETYATAYKLQQTLQALPFAKEKHKGQKRKVAKGNRQPYITHPLTMARHAISMGLTEDSLLAAMLLHDVCEDCGVAPQELPVEAEVQEVVRLVTRIDGETKEKYYDQIRENRIATLVKLIDRCHNVSQMALAFSREKLWKYIDETENYILPLLMEAKDKWPEQAQQYFLLEYQITSQLQSIRSLLEREDL